MLGGGYGATPKPMASSCAISYAHFVFHAIDNNRTISALDINMKKVREFLDRIIKEWISTTILGVLLIVGSSSWSWINNLLFAPPYDFVYTFEKQPNPLKNAKERMRSSMQDVFAEMKKAKLQSYNETEYVALLDIMPKFLERMTEEIDADQIHVWMLNLSRRPLDPVNISFQGCTGFVRLETNPLALDTNESNKSKTDISSNGVVYRFGAVKPQTGAFLKAGFNDIRNCSVVIDARQNDSELATVKYVTWDEYREYRASLRPERTNLISYLVVWAGCTLGLLLILFSLIYRSINQRLSKLEKTTTRSRRT